MGHIIVVQSCIAPNKNDVSHIHAFAVFTNLSFLVQRETRVENLRIYKILHVHDYNNYNHKYFKMPLI